MFADRLLHSDVRRWRPPTLRNSAFAWSVAPAAAHQAEQLQAQLLRGVFSTLLTEGCETCRSLAAALIEPVV